MKHSQLNILIANIYIAGSFLTNHLSDSFVMLFLGIIFFVWGIMAMKIEIDFEKFKSANRRR